MITQYFPPVSSRQRGIGALQIILSLALVTGLSVLAIPKYEAFVAKSKIQEGFNLASDSKAKLAEFFIAKGRFPRNDRETPSIRTQTLTPPEFVRDVIIEQDGVGDEVVIRSFFKDGVLGGDIGPDDHVYLTGSTARDSAALIEWACGATGISIDWLPAQCS